MVSVVMPVHNGERFLAQAIDSVLAQEYPHREIVLVDDGSTDASGAIAAELPVRYLAAEPGGRGGAQRRRGRSPGAISSRSSTRTTSGCPRSSPSRSTTSASARAWTW